MNSGPAGNPWQKIDQENIWHPFGPLVGGPETTMVVSGNGARLTTAQGTELIDGISSWWVNIHGHGNPEIAQAISNQAHKLEQVIFAGFTHEPAIELTSNLLKILPPDFSRVFFSDDGSTSVEVALKMAIQYWFNRGEERSRIIALDGAYHGDTFGSMSVGARGAFNLPFHPFLFEVEFLPFPTVENQEQVLEKMKSLVKDGQAAAFIFEPLVQGAGGMRMYSPEILDQLIAVAREEGVVCIADEVMTGFGRTGKTFASDYLQHDPDIFCLSKGITGGFLPMGVTCCNSRVEKEFLSEEVRATFFHGHSYTANPLACAAANASYSILMDPRTQDRIQFIGQNHRDFCQSLADHPRVRDVRSRGTIMAVELEVGGTTSYFDSNRKKIYDFFMDRNILLRPLGNTIYVLPPYVIEPDDLQTIYRAIRDFLEDS